MQLWSLCGVVDPHSTETYPRDRRGYQTRSDLITALAIGGRGVALPMLAAQDSFTLGRAAMCDLRADERYLAGMHARIERVAGSRASIKVVNVSNGKNDIVYGEVAESQFVMGAGEWFTIGETRYYALNEEMRLERPAVVEVLGVHNHDAIDEFLISAIRDSARHVVLIGESGCDQDKLGRIIHRISHRRHNRFLIIAEPKPKLHGQLQQDLRDSSNGTLLVTLDQKGRLDQFLVEAIADPAASLRLIICAHSKEKAEASFPASVMNEAKQIVIPSLRERANGEIHELLDRWFIAQRAQIRFSELRPGLRQGLLSYTWPGNLQELREAADYLVHLSQCGSGRQAAKAATFSRGALRRWIQRLNLTIKYPIISSED